MFKQFIVIGLLFAIGFGFGSLATPVGVDWSKELSQPESCAPVHQKQPTQRSTKKVYA